MCGIEVEEKVETERIVVIKLTGKDIIKAVADVNGIDIPSSATCKFQVPGGGDYSNTAVDVDKHAKVVIRFTERK